MKLFGALLVAVSFCAVNGWYMPNKRRTISLDSVGYPVAYGGLGNSFASTIPMTYANINQELVDPCVLPSVCRVATFKPDIYSSFYPQTVMASNRAVTPVSSMSTAQSLGSSNTVSVGGGYKVMSS
ncbi:uncharacterized protein LOC100904095 [Galendromus occidentalis]|uniref:Uncharacterized protein LOC100904095 n=1 Tax=Galendromus occidentalis TaxID=34638 RepID=A0AAJ6VZR2_9ACAR|nr:uncharacterized protein LOC100904095 [Galendromus occidentalis]